MFINPEGCFTWGRVSLPDVLLLFHDITLLTIFCFKPDLSFFNLTPSTGFFVFFPVFIVLPAGTFLITSETYDEFSTIRTRFESVSTFRTIRDVLLICRVFRFGHSSRTSTWNSIMKNLTEFWLSKTSKKHLSRYFSRPTKFSLK